METVRPAPLPEKNAGAANAILVIAVRLSTARTKGELGAILSDEIQMYSMFDLQIIGGRLNCEIEKLPSPYRESIRPYFREQLFRKTPPVSLHCTTKEHLTG